MLSCCCVFFSTEIVSIGVGNRMRVSVKYTYNFNTNLNVKTEEWEKKERTRKRDRIEWCKARNESHLSLWPCDLWKVNIIWVRISSIRFLFSLSFALSIFFSLWYFGEMVLCVNNTYIYYLHRVFMGIALHHSAALLLFFSSSLVYWKGNALSI